MGLSIMVWHSSLKKMKLLVFCLNAKIYIRLVLSSHPDYLTWVAAVVTSTELETADSSASWAMTGRIGSHHAAMVQTSVIANVIQHTIFQPCMNESKYLGSIPPPLMNSS